MSIKSFIAGCLCAIVAGSFVGGVTGYLETRAAIIQPKLCYSDIWVTDYEVIGTGRLESISGKYPYLEHRLDVYTDGTAKYYEYNNHEWDSYSYDPDCTVIFDGYGTGWELLYYTSAIPRELSENRGQIVPEALLDFYERKYNEFDGTEYFALKTAYNYSQPFTKEYFEAFDTVSDEELSKMFSWNVIDPSHSRKYTFSQPKCYNLSKLGVTYNTINEFFESYKNIGNSLYPYTDYSNDYKYYGINHDIKFSKERTTYTLRRDCEMVEMINNDVYDKSSGIDILSIDRTEYKGEWIGKLANLPFVNNKDNPYYRYSCIQYREITPTTDFTNGMSFTFGDHQTEVPASAFTSEEPIINQESLEDRVIALERENQELRDSAESRVGDINLDGSITAADAQLVLRYYLESEVLGNDIPDIVTWANQKEE